MCNKKICCRSCHFLSKYSRTDTGQTIMLSWNAKERESGEVHKNWCPECYHNVWSAGIDPGLKLKLTELIDRPRDECFFFPVKEGMSFQAASILQERKSQKLCS